jgi:hypothetical protein
MCGLNFSAETVDTSQIRQQSHSGTSSAIRILGKSGLSIHAPDRMEYDQPQNDETACVIAQQYSSATFVSLSFHSHKEKKNTARILKMILFYF